MKKPEKIEPNCPLIQSPCVEDGCKFWMKMERRDIATGARQEYAECAFVIQIAMMTENSMAINRVNAGIDALKNIVDRPMPIPVPFMDGNYRMAGLEGK